jgi:hypothetical protein
MAKQITRTGLSASVVAQKVAEYLKERRPGGVTVAVDPEGVQERESSWRVRVRPSEEPSRLFRYYEDLADVEIELEEREQLNVWLVTADPEHSPSAQDQLPITHGSPSALPPAQTRKRRPTGAKPAV